jgi:hypothetical protein
MATRLKHAWFTRIAVVAAAVALPLFAVGTAQAAIAGANPGTTLNAPDLVSASLTGTSTASVCFDKPLATAAGAVNAPSFFLSGYGAGNYVAGTTAFANGNCAIVTFNPIPATPPGDINQYTIINARAGAVTAASTGVQNLSDSTSLILSSTHNGTAGNTVAPNLTAVTVSTATVPVKLLFQYDKAVVGISGAAGAFKYYNSAGNPCSNAAGTAAASGTNNVLVDFTGGTGTGCTADIVNGDSQPGAVVAASTAFNGGAPAVSPLESSAVSATGCPTFNPCLTSAKLDPSNTDAIDYTFNQAFTGGTTVPAGGFKVVLSTGKSITSTAATITTAGPNAVVQATFSGNLAAQQEYAVQTNIPAGGIVNGTAGANIDQSTPVGDNSGAFARGFTTGPDVTAVSFSGSTATVTVDQRLCGTSGGVPVAGCTNYLQSGTTGLITAPGANPSGISAVPNTTVGSQTATGVTYATTAAAGAQVLTVTFGSALSADAFLQFAGCTNNGFVPPSSGAAFQAVLQAANANQACDPYSVQQIVAPVSSGAIAKAERTIKAHVRAIKARKAKHHSKRH